MGLTGASDYRYRLFGSNGPASLGRDLTARHLSVWPPKVARAIRARVGTVVSRRIPVGAHIVTARYIGGRLHRGQSVFEEVMWPLSYGTGCGGAVLVLSARVPDKTSMSAEILLTTIGRQSVWFSADGAPLPRPPSTADVVGR